MLRISLTKVQYRDPNCGRAITQSKQDPKCRVCRYAENLAKVAGYPGYIWEACKCSAPTAHSTMRCHLKKGLSVKRLFNHFCTIYNMCTCLLPLLNMNYVHERSLCEGSGLKLWLSSSKSGGH